MESTFERKTSLYTKDVLPARAVRHINNTASLEPAIKEQLSTIKMLEAKKSALQNELLSAIGSILDNSDSMSCGVLGEEFLQNLLNEIEVEEKAIRTKILGKQECVEMFKDAVSNNEVSSSYLEASRMQRDEITSILFTVVDAREKVFAALEVVKRTALPSSLEAKETSLTTLKKSYSDVMMSLFQEKEKLKLLTEFQRNPGKMEKQRKKLKLLLWKHVCILCVYKLEEFSISFPSHFFFLVQNAWEIPKLTFFTTTTGKDHTKWMDYVQFPSVWQQESSMVYIAAGHISAI